MKYFVILLILIGFVGTVFGQYIGDKIPPGTIIDDQTGSHTFPKNYLDFYYSDSFQQFSLISGSYQYDVPYKISNGVLTKMSIDCNNVELVLEIEPTDDQGLITVALPRYLIDAKLGNDIDDAFIVFQDSNEIQFTELEVVDAKLRILLIPFSRDVSKIRIIGVNYSEALGENACNGKHKPPLSYFVPPLKQFKYGIPIEEIQCKEGLELTLKSSDDSPACVNPETKQMLVERGWVKRAETELISWKKYITLSAARVDLPSANSPPVSNLDFVASNSTLYKSLVGADGCKDGTEVCAMSDGITLERFYPFGMSVTDNEEYSMTLNYAQAANIISDLNWAVDGDFVYTVIKWNENHYLLTLSTSDHAKTPDIAISLVGTVRTPVPLDRGNVLTYPIQVSTWATYGDSAQVDLAAVQGARDSGIDVWVEPDMLTIPERSNATATLLIRAQNDAQDGIYDIRVIGRANGNNAGLHCGNAVCPAVVIGGSDWKIRTFGTNSGMGIGAGDAPDHTWAEIHLNKKEFFENDTVEIKAYLVNNGTRPITLDSELNLLIKVIKAEPNGYYDHFYGIDAVKESGKSVVLEPKSKTLLARPFHWDQKTFSDFSDWQRLEPGMRLITADITSGSNTWSSEAWVEIK